MGEAEDVCEYEDYLMDLKLLYSKKESIECRNGIEVEEESSADLDYLRFLRGEELCGSEKKRMDNEIEVAESSAVMDCGKFVHGEEQDLEEEEKQDSELDPDLEILLSNIGEEWESFPFDIPSNSDSQEDDEFDSDYEEFLENVKVDSHSFRYEIPSSSGVTVYGFEELSSKEVERKITSKRDSRGVKAKFPGKEAKVVKKFSKTGEGSKNVVRGVPNKGRKRVVNVDEIREKDEDEDDCMPYKKPLNSQAKQSKKARAEKKFSKTGGERSISIVDVPCERTVNVEEIKEEDENENDFIPCKSSGEPSKNMNCVIRDESYGKFLNSFAKNDRHQKDDESYSDLEILASENIHFLERGYTPFVSSKCYQSLKTGEECREVIENSSQSLFRKKLTNLLKKPYDEEEFQHLWKEITDRKPVQRSKETRRRVVVYRTTADGKSYLDWYNELRVKIDEVRPDRQKILYLLRGFFFWLENTAHEGAFKPWFDSLYLKALR